MLVAILVAIRDFLIATALAWVGITLEQRPATDACASETCEVGAQDR